MHHPQPLRIFGYGSLIAAPEHADAVARWRPAVLPRYRRRFDKRSTPRGCPAADAFDALDVPAAFRADGHCHSLVVSVAPSDGPRIVDGTLLEWPATVADAVLADTDVREGYDSASARARLGYLRERVQVHADGEVATCWTYVANPGGDYHAVLPVDVQARVLVNATPRPGTPTAADGRARGLGYLELLRSALFERGVVDPYLESLAGAVLDYSGPWRSLVAAPRRNSAE